MVALSIFLFFSSSPPKRSSPPPPPQTHWFRVPNPPQNSSNYRRSPIIFLPFFAIMKKRKLLNHLAIETPSGVHHQYRLHSWWTHFHVKVEGDMILSVLLRRLILSSRTGTHGMPQVGDKQTHQDILTVSQHCNSKAEEGIFAFFGESIAATF